MSSYSSFERLKVEALGEGVVELIMDFVGDSNLYDGQAHKELAEIWPVLDADDSVKVVVMRGARGVMCGGSVRELVDVTMTDWNRTIQSFREARQIVFGVADCSKIVISAIEGAAVGAVLAAALVADISIIGNEAKLIDPHTRVGVAAGDGAVFNWPILCGMAKAKYYLLTGRPLKGAEADRIGMVSMAVPDDQVVATARDVAKRIAQSPFLGNSMTKIALNCWYKLAAPAFETSIALEMLTMKDPEAQAKIG